MKMSTKIKTAALFAVILAGTMASPQTERLAFSLTAPSSALLDASLTLAANHLEVAKPDADFVRLAKR